MKKPFFAKFLENQIPAEAQSKVMGGDPSDTPACDGPAAAHNPECLVAVTLKFPCDEADQNQPCP